MVVVLPNRNELTLAPGQVEDEDAAMSSTTTISSYEDACAQHRWEVPERYNIAVDICDKHPTRRRRLAPRPVTVR
jgi:hypothetical protein